jgi:hypothetical protein
MFDVLKAVTVNSAIFWEPLHGIYLHGSLFDDKDVDSAFLRNVRKFYYTKQRDIPEDYNFQTEVLFHESSSSGHKRA